MRTGSEWQDDILVATSDAARAPSGKFTDDPDVAERDNEAMRMRAAGKTYQEIAMKLGYASRGAARTQIERAYIARAKAPVEALREELTDQLEELVRRIAEVMDTRHLKVVNGSTVFNPETGGLMEDDSPVLAGADRWLKAIERMAKLHGLDAPQRIQAQVEQVRVTVDGAEDV
jgi:DNA-binding CsgD family transcriptional regulator